MRIRTIKPEFYTHEELYDLEQSTGLPIRVAYTGLWCAADREGRFKWEPRRLKLAILPFDEIDFSRVLVALESRGFIRKYRVDEKEYGTIPTFSDHQSINNKEKDSSLPKPHDYVGCDALPSREDRVNFATQNDLGGREGKGREKEGEVSRRGRADDPLEIPSDFATETQSALADWKKHRKEIKKSLTPTQWDKLIEDCRKNQPLMTATIRKSVVSGWQGLFPEKILPSEILQLSTPQSAPSWLPDNWREIAIKLDGPQAAEYSSHTQITPFNRHDFERACKGEIDLFGEDAA